MPVAKKENEKHGEIERNTMERWPKLKYKFVGDNINKTWPDYPEGGGSLHVEYRCLTWM